MSESPDLSRQSSIATQSPEPESSRKRKAAEDDADPDAKKPSKRALKRQKLKASGKKYKKPAAAVDPMYADIDEENQINPAIGKMDVGLLADHVSRQTKKFEPELSVVELEDRRVPGEHAYVQL
jgi:protein CMS1